jgi:hypothetical protein
MRLITDEQFDKVRYALAINRIMARDTNGDYTKEVTPTLIKEALKIMDELEVKEDTNE